MVDGGDDQALEEEMVPDPLQDRRIAEVSRIPNKPLSLERVYLRGTKLPNTELIKNFQMAQGLLSKEAFMAIV